MIHCILFADGTTLGPAGVCGTVQRHSTQSSHPHYSGSGAQLQCGTEGGQREEGEGGEGEDGTVHGQAREHQSHCRAKW